MMAMWFALGVLCGGVMSLCLRKEKRRADVEKSEDTASAHPRKVWAETRNFLYYDGTVMPEIKEDLNE